ncbi:GNAT family N-acetyltransferase [Arthrobacter psychrolactophilus]
MTKNREIMSASTAYPHGPRLGLREFTPSDTAAVHEYTSDPEVTRWSTWGPEHLRADRCLRRTCRTGSTESRKIGLLLGCHR